MTGRLPLIVYDFDGTLVDSFEAILAAFERVAPWLAIAPLTRAELPALRELPMREVLDKSGVALWKLPILVTAIRFSSRRDPRALVPFAGIADAIRTIEGAGLRQSVLSSNARANIQRFLDAQGLAQFEQVVGDVGLFGKASALRKLASRTGCAAADLVYVGDQESDIEAARSIGARSIAVTWGYGGRRALLSQQPTHVVDHVDELVATLLSL